MRRFMSVLGMLVGIAIGLPAFAQSAPTPSAPTPPVLQHTMGPARIPVRDQAAIDLPGGYAFFPETSGKELMEKMGNRVDGTFVGLIFPQKSSDWFILVEYQPAGHISDDDAKNWDADDLLNQVRTSTAAANEERHKEGKTELEVVGWAEKPHYDAATRRLVWSLEARDKGQTDSSRNIVNYKTLMLGREGYVSMTMVSPLATVGSDKEFVNLLLSKLDFTQGRKYADFDAKTDHIAEYGLAALIAGVAVKKLGLIALAVAFVLKFAKVIALAVFGGLAAFRRIFRRKPPAAPAYSPAPPPMMAGEPTRTEPGP
jgi:uncharacterized membrane-anchored protein